MGLVVVIVWLSSGTVTVRRPAGFPLPAGHLEAVERTHYGCRWLWSLRTVQPCHHVPDRWPHFCDELATYRVQEAGRTARYYCDRHAGVTAGESVELCAVCTGPLDPAAGGTHPNCAPEAGHVTYQEAHELVTGTLGATIEKGEAT